MKRLRTKNEGALQASDMHSASNKILYWSIFALLLVVALVCLLPPLWIFVSSFKSAKEIMQIPPKFLAENISFEKFGEVWKMLGFSRFYVNTIVLAIGSIISAVIINGITGYVLSCLKPRGTALIISLITWTMLLPNTLSMVPLFKNMINLPILGLNLSNTYWPMWMVAGANAFNILLFKNFFDSIPISLIEAARLDGCGRIRIFSRIVLPLSTPIIAVVSIFTLNGTWGDFLLPYLILNNREKYTVMIQIYNTRSTIPIDQQIVSLVFAIVPPMVVFFFFQKHIMGGVTAGGVKE